MTVHRIRFQGPAAIAVHAATDLADADGVDLLSSEQPSRVDEYTVGLEVSVEGSRDDVAAAVARIGADLPAGASIAIVD